MNITPLNGQLYVAPRIIKPVEQEENQNVVVLNNQQVLNTEEQPVAPNYGNATTAQYLANMGIKLVVTTKVNVENDEVSPVVRETENAPEENDDELHLPDSIQQNTTKANGNKRGFFRKLWDGIKKVALATWETIKENGVGIITHPIDAVIDWGKNIYDQFHQSNI